MKNPFIVAGIPAYNEAENIKLVILGVKDHVNEVIVCDDGSLDSTGVIATQSGVNVITHERNMGYGKAIQSIFNMAKKLGADILVTIDADGQHNPNDLPKLVEHLMNSDADIVIGSRFVSGGDSETPYWRKMGIKFLTGIAANGLKITDGQSGFRVYNRKAIESLILTEDGMGVSSEILLKSKELNFNIAEFPVKIIYNKHSSAMNPLFHGFEVLLSTIKYLSIRRPLLFYGVPGFITLLIAGFFWFLTIRTFSLSRTISTNVTLIALSATIVGLMLMTTSIILWVIISVVRENFIVI